MGASGVGEFFFIIYLIFAKISLMSCRQTLQFRENLVRDGGSLQADILEAFENALTYGSFEFATVNYSLIQTYTSLPSEIAVILGKS
jgi:hypothetical protein